MPFSMVDAIAINLGLGYGDILANPVKLKEFNQNSVTQENLSKPRRPGYLPSHRVLRRGVPQYVRYYGGDQRNYNRMLEDTVDEALEIAQVDRRTEDDDVRGRCPWCPTDFEVRAWQDMGAEGPPTDPRAPSPRAVQVTFALVELPALLVWPREVALVLDAVSEDRSLRRQLCRIEVLHHSLIMCYHAPTTAEKAAVMEARAAETAEVARKYKVNQEHVDAWTRAL
ncbi:hypothetical protein F4820DRAFT_453116 [Hypoxylon rubiginosum]|uniref:Uncharacterized protein n=1 Tax=Hypoxylon rubiginosum TaxID=110542 RepID=A0ACB9YM54_9PEZI|nr:hypothetical protein F4820DRAFT_453116 [Hypoxylon rubiginosum]